MVKVSSVALVGSTGDSKEDPHKCVHMSLLHLWSSYAVLILNSIF